MTEGYKPCDLCGSTIPDEPNELDDLRAEVERLRGEADRERAAVVSWLRECALDPETTGAEMRLLQEHASRIERGDHCDRSKEDE